MFTTLVLNDISKIYHKKRGVETTALSPIALSLERGSFTSIVGRSGCGKSTLLKIIAGLEAPSSGEISIEYSFSQAEAQERPSFRYVFQNYSESLLPWRNIRENIRFGIRHSARKSGAAGMDKTTQNEQIAAYLAEVGLYGVEDKYPNELSGGMQQRVAIARALASQPDILLLDEPFSAVDALSRQNLQDLLLQIWTERNMTTVFVTHDIDEAVYLSENVLVLDPYGNGASLFQEINLKYPRKQIESRSEEHFIHLRNKIMDNFIS